MNVVNCRKCGKLFNHISGPNICPACKDALEQKFQEVKAYIREHRDCGIAEVCEACDVETAQIQNWIRQERLEFSESSGVKINCEHCGAPILTGRFCEKCKKEMSDNLGSVLHRPAENRPDPSASKQSDKNRMRFL